jgi:hypothetical protein
VCARTTSRESIGDALVLHHDEWPQDVLFPYGGGNFLL